MLLPDSVFCESIHNELMSKSSPVEKQRVSFNQNVLKLEEILLKSEEPLDYYEISEALNLPLAERKYSGNRAYPDPARAKACIKGLLRKYPDCFEMTTVIKTKKNGTVYEAPAVKAVRKKPNYKIGQKINLVNCPDGEHTPDKIWIIRTEPFWFEGMWRVCIHDWIGSIPVENIKAVSKDRS